MSVKILLTGKNGQIGRELQRALPALGELVALDRQQLDLASPEEVRRVVSQVRPDLIVNAAAYTAVDQAEKEESLARAINADAPAALAAEAKKLGAALLHYSTDYVFDGAKASPYDEDDPPNPLNAYGRTKLAGEQAIRETSTPHLIFRTEWVYAKRGRNFLLTILRLANEREELRIVSDQIGSPTSSREIADATTQILTQVLGQSKSHASWRDLSGTYHMTAAGKTSWYEFAKSILEEARQADLSIEWLASATGGRPLIARRVVPIPTKDYPTPARRPAYSVLSNARLEQAFNVQLPDWRAQLQTIFSTE